jgi:ubiquinone/menaquinone biosynthesis C-methylase UbiE
MLVVVLDVIVSCWPKKGAKVIGDPSSKMLEYAKRKITPDCEFELRLGALALRRLSTIEL